MKRESRRSNETACIAGLAVIIFASHLQTAQDSDHFLELQATIISLDEIIRENSESAQAYQSRGVAYFEMGEFKKSISDFDRVIEIAPSQEPHHWQRGISYYYAGEYEKGAKQFELHRSVNPNDVENAVWHFICKAKLDGPEAAKEALIPISYDSRIPMSAIWKLYSGEETPESVLEVCGTPDPSSRLSRQRFNYAHLYIGLYHEAFDRTQLAKKHIKLAATTFTMDNYMGMVAHVHHRLLNQVSISN